MRLTGRSNPSLDISVMPFAHNHVRLLQDLEAVEEKLGQWVLKVGGEGDGVCVEGGGGGLEGAGTGGGGGRSAQRVNALFLTERLQLHD